MIECEYCRLIVRILYPTTLLPWQLYVCHRWLGHDGPTS